MLIHGFWLVNARLLMAFGTAFYAIIILNFVYHYMKFEENPFYTFGVLFRTRKTDKGKYLKDRPDRDIGLANCTSP